MALKINDPGGIGVAFHTVRRNRRFSKTRDGRQKRTFLQIMNANGINPSELRILLMRVASCGVVVILGGQVGKRRCFRETRSANLPI